MRERLLHLVSNDEGSIFWNTPVDSENTDYLKNNLMKKLKSVLLLCIIFAFTNIWAQEKNFIEDIYSYIENPEVFKLGQEEPRAYHIPDNNILLNGSWRFFYGNTPEEIPGKFYEIGFADAGWDMISVPANWEMEGYGDPFFRNVGAGYCLGRMSRSWRKKRTRKHLSPTPLPQTPVEYNPSGAYRTSFVLPEKWNGKEFFLRFDKIGCASFVWINGKQVGFNEGSHEVAEYNISSYLKKGENTLAVLITKFSDAYYLEGIDAWRLAGIMDDVHVFATPKVRLFDWQVITDLDETYTNANLYLNVDIKSNGQAGTGLNVAATITKDGKEISVLEGESVNIEKDAWTKVALETYIENPELWTAETPSLYELHIKLFDKDNKLIDQIKTRMGFKETEIIGNTFYLNGKPIKINGINSHMQHPELGRVMNEETIRKDLEILKQFNINSVRTSHYPPTHRYIELADEYGIYIVDEVNVEAHATSYLSKNKDYKAMYLDRTRKAVLRDRNHVSVLFWSAGNESGEGSNITEVIKLGKELDPSRFWMYGGNAAVHPAEDIIGPRYPTPIEQEIKVGMDESDNRPSFMDEYVSVAGNAGGGLDEYWRTIYSHSKLMGGAIWDFVSPGITEPIRKLQDDSKYNTPVHIMGRAKLVEGQSGNVIDLNGHDQWVEVYNADNINFSGDQLTITMDVFPRQLSSMGGYYITKGSNQFGLQQKGTNSLDFYLFNGEKQIISAFLPDNWENNWHNITAEYNGEAMKLYIDGNELASEEVSGAIVNLPWPINIGRDFEKHGDGTSEYICDALIDNVGVFTSVKEPGKKLKKDDAILWLSFEKETNEGDFYSYGIGARTYGSIWPDRTPQPEMWQIKKVGEPLAFKLLNADKGTMEVWNHNCFLNASHWQTTWTLTENDKVIQSGDLNIDVTPMKRGNVRIPYHYPKIKPGKEYRVNISSKLKEKEVWASKGFEVSWAQFELEDWFVKPVAIVSKREAKLSIHNEYYLVSGKDFEYKFNKKTGELFSLLSGGKEILQTPLKLNVWRAPIATEQDSWSATGFKSKEWKEEYGWMIATEYYSFGLDNLRQIPLEIRATDANGKVHIYVREQVLLNGGKTEEAQLDKYIKGQKYDGLECVYDYVIDGDGIITMEHTIQPLGSMPQFFPRIGVSMMLQDEFSNVEWHGRGPEENYPDRKSGYPLGIYKSTVDNMYEPYLIPQDFGLRTDNRWVRMSDSKGVGIEVSMNMLFNFNTYHYTTDNLTKARYTFQLQKANGVTLNLDYKTTGVGETARGIFNSYRVYPQAYNRKVIIRPFR